VTYTPAFMPVLAARNLLLIAITVRAVLRPKRSGPEPQRAATAVSTALRETALREAAPRVTHSGDHHTIAATERQGRATVRGQQVWDRGSR